MRLFISKGVTLRVTSDSRGFSNPSLAGGGLTTDDYSIHLGTGDGRRRKRDRWMRRTRRPRPPKHGCVVQAVTWFRLSKCLHRRICMESDLFKPKP